MQLLISLTKSRDTACLRSTNSTFLPPFSMKRKLRKLIYIYTSYLFQPDNFLLVKFIKESMFVSLKSFIYIRTKQKIASPIVN